MLTEIEEGAIARGFGQVLIIPFPRGPVYIANPDLAKFCALDKADPVDSYWAHRWFETHPQGSVTEFLTAVRNRPLESKMSKTVPLKDFGIPVPTPAPDPTDHLIVYYGLHPLTPSYTQAAVIDAGPVSALTTTTVNGVAYWDDPIGTELPGGLGNGSYDFVFTLRDAQGNEGDFSPPITATVDTVVPPTLGAPIVLGSASASVAPAAAPKA